MHTDTRTHPTTPSPSPIPWWDDLDPPVRAQLELPDIRALAAQTVDVIVIGGGVAGLSSALSACSAGARVLVLERDGLLGRGATGRNAGILSAGINMNLADLDPAGPAAAFWPETTRELLALTEQATRPGAILQARLTGSLNLAESATAAHTLLREARARLAAGLRAEIWTPEQVRAATAGRLNTKDLVNALWLPDEGCIQPLTLLAHLARRARTEGIVLAGQAIVEKYREIHGNAGDHYWQLALGDGMTICARGLIRAVGPTVEANACIYALAFAADLPAAFPLFWDTAPYIYADYRPGDGRLTVSGGRYGKAGVTRRAGLYYQRLAQSARHWLPELMGQEPRYSWGVDIAVAADMVPTLREFGERAPACAIEGRGAQGLLPGIVLGQEAGELITGKLA
jgi:glycine/D-amino acid oxidase-like deaminating enzyme